MIDKKSFKDHPDVYCAVLETLMNTDTFCSVFDASRKGHVSYQLHLDDEGNIKDQHSEMTSNDRVITGEMNVPEQDDIDSRDWELLSVYGGDVFKLMCSEIADRYIELVFGSDADIYDLQNKYSFD